MAQSPAIVSMNLFVRDMAASVAFYRRLGFDVTDGAEGHPHVEITMASGFALELDTYALTRAYDPGWREPEVGHRSGCVFQVLLPSREAVDRACAALEADGHRIHLAPIDAFWGARYAVAIDPDGNFVGLTSGQDPQHMGAVPKL